MAGNSIGKNLVLTTFGESHGAAVGGILDGFPSLITIDLAFIQSEINRRNPAKYPFATPRKEDDKLEILSGVFEGTSTGAPIAFLVKNLDQRPEDYDHLKDLYRPSHADFTYEARYGIRDPRGGGRASARATLAVVAGGAFAKLLLSLQNISITGYVSQIGPHALPEGFTLSDRALVRLSPLSCPHEKTTQKILDYLHGLKQEGDTAGGVISCIIQGVPAGIGDPVFDKLQADLAKAMLSINAVKGFEYGSGFKAAGMKGSEHNDEFILEENLIKTRTNHSGGIQGGISNRMDITFNVAFKPISTLSMEQQTINRDGDQITYKAEGRHDVCVVPRAVPIVEAMAALTLADKLRQV
ncbi:MAG: chorismate synthase [Bacteroidales bacterium]|nr:chorismate synthase [Bacteroidales bacterium]